MQRRRWVVFVQALAALPSCVRLCNYNAAVERKKGSSGICGEGRSDVREQILGRRGAPTLRGGPHWARKGWSGAVKGGAGRKRGWYHQMEPMSTRRSQRSCIIHRRARRARRGLFWKVIHPNHLCALGGLGGDYFARPGPRHACRGRGAITSDGRILPLGAARLVDGSTPISLTSVLLRVLCGKGEDSPEARNRTLASALTPANPGRTKKEPHRHSADGTLPLF